MNVLALLQARVSSTRLPGKVLKPILDVPMILRQVERIQMAKSIDKLVVATSNDSSDDALEMLCRKNNISCFRGSLNDVLDRFYRAAVEYKPLHVVRLTGDCPLIDPTIIDQVIHLHLTQNNDYTSNNHPPTFPDGLDVEVVKFSCLEVAAREATRSSEREHVTPFFYTHPERFKVENYAGREDLSALRWTVDESEDLALVEAIYSALYPVNPMFKMPDVLALLKTRPALAKLNSKFTRNEGYKKSLARDKD